MIICLAGFSGSGKSSLLQRWKLQVSDGWIFKDLDDLIAERCEEGVTIADYFRSHGWDKFRALEKEVLLETLAQSSRIGGNLVLALGGGTLEHGLDSIKEMKEVFLVGLDVGFETCWSRIRNDENRPLVQIGKEMLKQKYEHRRLLLLSSDLLLSEDEIQETNLRDLETRLKQAPA